MFEPLLLSAHNPSPMTGEGNNTYLLAGRGEPAVLIDAGVGEPAHVEAIAAALRERQTALGLVLVTHGHGDHAGGAPTLGAAHPSAAFAKHPWPEEDHRYSVGWQTIGEGDVITANGEALAVLHTPGHSPDHLALWHEPTRTLFTGDLVVRGSSVMIHSSRGGNLAQYLASLQRLLSLDPLRLLPAHGPAIDDPRAVISGYISHRLFRERQVESALRAGRATVEAIAESIYDGLSPALLPAAKENVRAHLEKLRSEGRASEIDGRWQT